MGRGKIQWGAFTVQVPKGFVRRAYLEQVRPQAGEGLEAKQAQTVPRVTWVSARIWAPGALGQTLSDTTM